jgi:hypothetical protein
MTLVQIILIASAAIGVLALLLYFVPVSKLKIPAIFLGAVAGLGIGAVIGMAATVYYGDAIAEAQRMHPIDDSGGASARNSRGGGAGAQQKTAGAQPGGGGDAAQRKGGRGGPPPQIQLAQLIAKLNLLATKALVIELTPEQKKLISEQINGLEDLKLLSRDDASAKIEAILGVVKENRTTLEDAGFNWPDGQGGRRGGQPGRLTNNPFSEGENSANVKSLRTAIGGSETKPSSGQG